MRLKNYAAHYTRVNTVGTVLSLEDSVEKGFATYPQICPHLKNSMFGNRCKYYHPEKHRHLTYGTNAAYSQGNIGTSSATGNFENRLGTELSLDDSVEKVFATYPRVCPYLKNCMFGNRCKYYHPEKHRHLTSGTKAVYSQGNIGTSSTTRNLFEQIRDNDIFRGLRQERLRDSPGNLPLFKELHVW